MTTQEDFLYNDWTDHISGGHVRFTHAPSSLDEADASSIRLIEREGISFVLINDTEVASFDTSLEAVVYANRIAEGINGSLDAVMMNLAGDSFKWRTASMIAASFLVENVKAGEYWEEGTEPQQIFEWLEQSAIIAMTPQPAEEDVPATEE
jgi:hypothetical protein